MTTAGLVLIGLTVLGALAYFTPSIIAVASRHSSRKAIILINLFGGWTVAGWVLALWWSLTDFGLGDWVRHRRHAIAQRDGATPTPDAAEPNPRQENL